MTLAHWNKELRESEVAWEKYLERGKKIVKRYRDEEKRPINRSSQYNILFSNTETIRPVLYSKSPVPDVRPSLSKAKDKAVKEASAYLETGLDYNCQDNFDSVMNSAVLDYCLPGMGVVRVKYLPTIDEDEVVYEEVVYEYINWKDVRFSAGKCWEDVTWVAFRALMTQKELEDTFDRSDIPLTHSKEGVKGDKGEYAEVWEVWDKTKRKQIFLVDTEIIEENDDPLGLKDFFPIPKPMFSISTGETLIPIPFYAMYQDQAIELDVISSRIRGLVDQIKKRGMYDSEFKEIGAMLSGGDNHYVALKNFRESINKGGLDNILVSEDVRPYAEVLLQLYQQREQIKQIIFEIMGISDIQRAQTDPSETASAQRLKAGFGKLRVSRYQREVQRFARDLIRLKAEIIAEKFSPETLVEIMGVEGKVLPSGEKMTPLQVVNEIILPIIRPQEPRQLSIDIETDSTIMDDDAYNQQEAQEVTELLTGLSGATAQLQAIYGVKFAGEFTKSILMKFNLPKGLMDALEERIDELLNTPPQPSAEEIKAQMEQAKMQADLQIKQADLQLRANDQELKKVELQLKAQEMGAKIDIEQQKVDLSGVALAVEAQEKEEKLDLDKAKLMAENANPNDNAIVGA